jgi:hypothetical protein
MTKYSINFAPIEIKGDTTVLIGRQAYDRDRLDALRREFRETHVFRRDGADNVILDVPVIAGQKPIGNIQEELDLARYQKLWPPLLSAALLRAFSGVRDIISDRPVSVVGALARGLVRHPNLPQWMQKRTLLRFDTRSIYAVSVVRVFGTGSGLK